MISSGHMYSNNLPLTPAVARKRTGVLLIISCGRLSFLIPSGVDWMLPCSIVSSCEGASFLHPVKSTMLIRTSEKTEAFDIVPVLWVRPGPKLSKGIKLKNSIT